MRKLLALFVFATVTSTASCLRCYVCNSYNDTGCLDIAPHSKSKFLADCNNPQDDKAPKLNENKTAVNYTLCRKIEMYFDKDFGEKHPQGFRIHRACGYIEDEEDRDCYYKSGYNTRSWICSCNIDDCNTSSLLTPTHLSLVLTLGCALIARLQRARRV